MTDIRWVTVAMALAIHEEQLTAHGGGEGVRDMGLLEGALARPHNLAAYSEPDLCALAAALAFGLAKNHPFIDGNKRTAYVAMEAFLGRNGLDLTADDPSCVVIMVDLAAGDIAESDLVTWLRDNTAPRS